MTTGGVPEGMPSEPPKIREMMNITALSAQTPSTIACTLLLRNIGNLDERFAYGGGFEDFLEGSAKCIIFKLAGLPAPLLSSSEGE